jgi:heptosyltransferase-2/heptosyltransferase-3
VREWGAEVLWLHGPGEDAAVAAARGLCQEDTVLAPKTTFREMAALLANTDLFIGNSNGPSHVAVAAGICSLQLHGPTHARAWCPLTDKHRALEAVATRAIEEITVEQVWEALCGMQATIQAFAAAARQKRPRLTWRG